MKFYLVIALLLGPSNEWTEFRIPVASLAACHAYLIARMKSRQELKDNVYFWCDRGVME